MSGLYLFQYYQLWGTAARNDHPLNSWWSESCRMDIWLAPSSLWWVIDPVYPTTNPRCSSCCTLDVHQSQRGELVQTRGVPTKRDVLGGTGYIWTYPCGIMFRRYVSHLQSNYHCRARNGVQRGVFSGHLQIGMIRFWSCPVRAWDVDISIISFAS